MHCCIGSICSKTCTLSPPLWPEKCGLYLQLVFSSRSILYMIITVWSEKGCLKIQVVFLDSGHIIQVSLYLFSIWCNITKSVVTKYFQKTGFVHFQMIHKIFNVYTNSVCLRCLHNVLVNESEMKLNLEWHASDSKDERKCFWTILCSEYSSLRNFCKLT